MAGQGVGQRVERERPVVCVYCEDALPYNHNGCIGCGLPVFSVPAAQSPQSAKCGPCRVQSVVDLCICAMVYDPVARHLVHKLKFQRGEREGKLLAQAMAKSVETTYAETQAPLPSLLLPVPLSRLNLAMRGYNQAALLAGHLSKRLSIPMDLRLLTRRHSKPQRKKTKSQRQRMPFNTFQLQTRQMPARLPDHVAIIDDVMTTGRTTRVLHTLLTGAGVRQVDIWCAARVVEH